MPTDRTRCSECGGTMEAGYILDSTKTDYRDSRWVPGTAERNWMGFLKYDLKTVRKVVTDRCPTCGFLKSYAPDIPK